MRAKCKGQYKKPEDRKNKYDTFEMTGGCGWSGSLESMYDEGKPKRCPECNGILEVDTGTRIRMR